MNLVDRAKKSLRERTQSIDALLVLAEELKQAELFDFACRVLALAREQRTSDAGKRSALALQHALCTYKNPDLPLTDRLDDALRILEGDIDLRSTKDQETLGIAGAIFKRKWQADGVTEHLETAFEYYYRGHVLGPAQDLGYTGVNAAHMLDLLVDAEVRQAARTGALAAAVDEHRARARTIRTEVIAALLALESTLRPDSSDASQWWFAVTLAEAHFGLEAFDQAQMWLERARRIKTIPQWMFDSTSQQLVSMARLQARAARTSIPTTESRLGLLTDTLGPGQIPGAALLQQFLEVSPPVIQSAALGTVGLALSGGGFRASLFHIGVLASLAEHDLLRHVQVLSCVSGGSIIGTYYYLELRLLLNTKPDADITPQDYIDIVRRIERDFLAGVQHNLRMRVLGDLADNWKMFFGRKYSRTHKIGELYEEYLYSRIHDEPDPAGESGASSGGSVNRGQPPRSPRYINDVRVNPVGAPPGFHPRLHNWRRQAKVPRLIINATTLNTGHQWQFTASFMGEPPATINTNVDGNFRLRRMYYAEAPPRYRAFRLGHAVGASSCVPGLFEPLQLPDLFPGMTVSLADGGVHDNQGIGSLIEQGCDNLIVSDASGQMGELERLGVGPLQVLYRSDTVFQARMRDIQFRDLQSRVASGVVTATYIHLKQGLEVTPKDWIGCDDPKENPAATTRATLFTRYGVRHDVQRLLAAVRTDLDSFCDAEAMALMTSGYLMMQRALADRGLAPKEGQYTWEFLRMEPAMRRADPRLMQILQHAGSLAFKVWGLLKPLRYVGVALLLLVLLVLAVTAWSTRHVPLLSLGMALFSVLTLALGTMLGPVVARWLAAPGWVRRAAVGILAGLFGWIVTTVHLRWFDRWYLAFGQRDKFE
jgi:predicted acylesterase/phospholipase RssA